jgi:hypothetical protein
MAPTSGFKRMSRCRRPPCLVMALFTVLMAGCAGDDKAQIPCPPILVLADGASLTAFAPGRGSDILDVDYQVDIVDVLSGCRVDKSDKKNPVLVVAVAPILAVSRGAANSGQPIRFSYFVSTINRAAEVVNKVEFPMAVQFEPNRNRIVMREDDPPVSVNFPLTPQSNPFDYEIIVGMQLTEPQLQYNRAQRAAVR